MANRGGRPTSLDIKRRKVGFLTLIAGGCDAKTAAKRSGLNPWQALEVVTESSFNEIVQAIRAGEMGPTAVVAAPTPGTGSIAA